jgi:hypothetical protein
MSLFSIFVKKFISIPKKLNMKNFKFFIVFYVIKSPANFHMIEMVNKAWFLISNTGLEFWR